MPDVRLCATCSEPVSKMRSGKFCSRECAAGIGRVLVHSCLSNILDPSRPTCLCKYRVSASLAKRMINRGEAVSFTTRTDVFDNGPLLAKIASRTPRSATIEKNHILGGVGITEGLKRRSSARDAREIERLRELVEADRAARAEEMRQRWDIYAELDRAMWAALTVPEVPDAWGEGRCLFATSWEDERTSHGKTIEAYQPDVFELEEQTNGEVVVERDENVISLAETEDVEELQYAEQEA